MIVEGGGLPIVERPAPARADEDFQFRGSIIHGLRISDAGRWRGEIQKSSRKLHGTLVLACELFQPDVVQSFLTTISRLISEKSLPALMIGGHAVTALVIHARPSISIF